MAVTLSETGKGRDLKGLIEREILRRRAVAAMPPDAASSSFGIPNLEDVKIACIHIGSHGKKTQYICSTDPSSGWIFDDYESCEISPELSAYYGEEVAVCLRSNHFS